jgi:hypothetical protein
MTERSYRLNEWLDLRRVSRPQHYKDQKAGRGVEVYYEGTNVMISPRADREYLARREAEAAARSVKTPRPANYGAKAEVAA